MGKFDFPKELGEDVIPKVETAFAIVSEDKDAVIQGQLYQVYFLPAKIIPEGAYPLEEARLALPLNNDRGVRTRTHEHVVDGVEDDLGDVGGVAAQLGDSVPRHLREQSQSAVLGPDQEGSAAVDVPEAAGLVRWGDQPGEHVLGCPRTHIVASHVLPGEDQKLIGHGLEVHLNGMQAMPFERGVLGDLVEFHDLEPGPQYAQLAHLDHIDELGDGGLPMHVHGLYALEVPNVPDFDTLLIIAAHDHGGSFDSHEGDHHGFVADHLAFEAGVQVLWVDLQHVDVVLAAGGEQHLVCVRVLQCVHATAARIHLQYEGALQKVIQKDFLLVLSSAELVDNTLLYQCDQTQGRHLANVVNPALSQQRQLL